MEELELLKRKLERERRARHEAEQLLETKSRELYLAKEELQRQYDALLRRNAKIELLDSVVKFAQQAPPFREMMQRFVDAVCSASGWPVGHVFVPREDPPHTLVPLKTWHIDDPQKYESFRRVTETMELESGLGLPGRVFATGEPAWIGDVRADTNFPRARVCQEIQVRAAFGVPIKAYERTLAVAEFYAGQTFEEDLWLLEMVNTTGQQIGSLLERRAAEEALDAVNQELRRRNDEMQQFVYTVSHDLKSPLVTIRGFAGMLKEELASGRSSEAGALLARILSGAEKMNRLIEDMLQLSRIGRVRSPPEWVETDEIVREVLEAVSSQLSEAGAAVEVPPGMPRVFTERMRLWQVFENLLANAIKYGCEGAAKRIVVGGETNGTESRFFVRDFGPGIAPEHHQKIFGLFQRLHSDSRGTGVGLAIVAKVLQVYGGKCWVESRPGEGATFWFTLPTRTPAQQAPAVAPAA